MQVVRKVAVLIALGLAFGSAMAGDISGSDVFSTSAANTSAGLLATARQSVGVAK